MRKGESGVLEVAKELWTIFKTLKKYTKELLLAVTTPGISKAVLGKYDLLPILQKHGEASFVQAQELIREEVLRTFSTLEPEDLLEERKMAQGQKFIEYFEITIEELKTSLFNKRYAAPSN